MRMGAGLVLGSWSTLRYCPQGNINDKDAEQAPKKGDLSKSKNGESSSSVA